MNAVQSATPALTTGSAVRTASHFGHSLRPAPSQTEDPGLLQYWPILWKHRWVILTTVAITVTVSVIISLRTRPTYEAIGRIAINRENSDVLGLKSIGDGASEDTDYDYTVTLDTQVKILESDAIAVSVARALQLDRTRFASLAEPATPLTPPKVNAQQEAAMIGFVHDGLNVSILPKTRILEIRFDSPDPQMAAKVVNTLVNVYVEQNFKTKFESAMQTSDWLSKQLSDLQVKVEASQEKLVRYQREHGILGIDEKQNIVTAKLDELNRELTAAEGDRIQKEATYRLASSGDPELIANGGADPLLAKLRAQETDLNTQLAQARVQLGPAHPKIKELESQREEVRADSRIEVAKISGRLKNDYLAASHREQMLRAALDDQKQQANKLNESAIEYSLLKRDVDTNRQLYEGLLQKLKEASVTAGLRSSNIRVVDFARVPPVPARPDKRRNVLLALAMGLVGGVVLAFLVEAVDNTVRTPEQAQMLTGLPTLGVIPSSPELVVGKSSRPALPSSADSVAIVSCERPRSDIVESYRALRTSILLSSTGAPPKVILVTSALPQEGKTTTSINTAVVLAQKGARVLLVDADLRRPSIHRVFNLAPRSGLSTLLAGTSGEESSIYPVPAGKGLALLPAGPIPPQPAELLHSEVMKAYLDKWRAEYDHIVIDTPPALSVTDAVLLSADADSVLLVLKAGSTTKAALRRTHDLLQQVNSRVMGLVVNAADVHSPEFFNSYYYGSKYGRYGDQVQAVADPA